MAGGVGQTPNMLNLSKRFREENPARKALSPILALCRPDAVRRLETLLAHKQ
jgi:hypothetical protein